jgi:hypothetical protein
MGPGEVFEMTVNLLMSDQGYTEAQCTCTCSVYINLPPPRMGSASTTQPIPLSDSLCKNGRSSRAQKEIKIYLLACSVENVQEAGLPIYDDLLPVAVLYGGVVLVHEMVLDQLDGEGGLAHASRCTLY